MHALHVEAVEAQRLAIYWRDIAANTTDTATAFLAERRARRAAWRARAALVKATAERVGDDTIAPIQYLHASCCTAADSALANARECLARAQGLLR